MTIVVYESTYTISSTVTISKVLAICGATRDGTIFQTAGTGTDPGTVFLVTVDDVALIGLTIRQQSTAASLSTAITASGDGATTVN